MKTIGILALQGDVEKHLLSTEKAGARGVLLKTPAQLEKVDGLIIPGGESTTIGKLLTRFSLLEPLKRKIENGFPVFGTCAGAILLAKGNIYTHYNRTSDQIKIGAIDIDISRNAYGPQVESFETDVSLSSISGTNESFRAIFIRAPIVTRVGENCQVLAYFENKPVLVREKNILIATFHPELTESTLVHSYFLSME